MCALENVAAVPGFLRSVRTIISEAAENMWVFSAECGKQVAQTWFHSTIR